MDTLSNLIHQMLSARRIAVVGISKDPSRPSHFIAQYLLEAGYDVVPVNPVLDTVMGLRCYASLAELPEPVDLVNVFRRAEFIPAIVTAAAQAHAGGLWVQSGIRSQEAMKLAQAVGIPYVQDRCIMIEHARWAR